MNQSALDRLVANRGGFGKARGHRIHHSAAFTRPQRMTWNAARLVHDDERRILEQQLEVIAVVRLDRCERRRRLDLDIVAGAHYRALDAAPAVQQDRAARHHLARIAPRRRVTGAHEIMVEPFAAGVSQGDCDCPAADEVALL
jgi:hypothetical protein